MDALSRRKARKAEEAKSAAQSVNNAAHEYNAKVRPRQAHPDSVSSDQQILRNLDKLNREFLDTPEASAEGVAIVAPRAKARASAPVAVILACLALVLIFMYMLSLNVRVEEYSRTISSLQSEVTALKENATALELQLESKYDLSEVERIATEEYGMVSADTLPKKYISVSPDEDVYQKTESTEKNGIEKLFENLMSSISELLS